MVQLRTGNSFFARAAFAMGVLVSLSSMVRAEELALASSPQEIITKGKPYVTARYRYETVDDKALLKDAYASTIRTRLGFQTARYRDLQVQVEVEDVSEIGSDSYNNTLNGKTARPVVADVDTTEVNQAYLSYTGLPSSTLTYGRKVINLDNERFIGEVAWRQNNQTFDSATFSNTSISNLTAWYGYVYNVNRIVGDASPVGDYRSDIHLINLKYAIPEVANVTAYTYLLDFDTQDALSSASSGLRIDGKRAVSESLAALYDVEYAHQTDYAKNPTNFAVDYWRTDAGLESHGVTLKAGYEVLGSDNGTAAFQTPLATLHRWNGWADKFLVTPATGLRDASLGLVYKMPDTYGVFSGPSLAIVCHRYESDYGNAHLGNEIDFEVSKSLSKNYMIGIMFAHYNADSEKN